MQVMLSQLFLLLAIFFLCIFLAYEDLRSAFIFLLLVSPLLHKEVFSLVRWDTLPVRIVMLSLIATCIFKFLLWFKKKRDYTEIKKYALDPMFILLALLWIVRAVSLVNSRNLQASLLLLAFYTTMVFLYVLISYLAKRYGEKFILSNIKFYSLIAFATAVVGLLQFVLDREFGIIFGALWRIPGKLSRVGSVFWDVNHYGGYLSSIIPITIGLFLISKSKTSKLFYAFTSLFMSVILLLTNSRSAWIGFGVSLLIIFLTLFISKFKTKGLIYICIALFLFFIPLFKAYRTPASPLREKINAYLQYRGDSFASHFMLLQGSFAIFSSHPIIGGGYGSFFEHFKETSVAATYYSRDPAALSVRVPAHSIWGEVLAETGVSGMFLFVLFVVLLLGTIFYAASKVKVVEKEKTYFLVALGASITGFLVSGIFYSYNAEFLFIVFFLSFIYAKSVLMDSYSIENVFSYLKEQKIFWILLISVISSLLLFVNIGTNHLIPWDEAIYAKVAKNMVKSGDFLIQSWEMGKAWYEKPPLYMWLEGLTLKIFGFNSLGVKLPSAVLGLFTIILVFLLGKKLFGSYVGFLASFILLTTSQFLYYSRIGMLDVSLTFFITASLYFYYFYVEQPANKKALLISGAFAGFAVMTKGVVGLLVFPMIALAEIYLYFANSKTFKITVLAKVKDAALFIVTFLLVALPWHMYMYSLYGKNFINNYFGYHVLKRATESVEGKGEPFFWYITVLRTSMRIWFVALIGSLFTYIVTFLSKKLASYETLLISVKNKNTTILVLWSVVIFVFFSSSVSKLIWYIIPIYPLLSLIIAAFFMSIFEFFTTVILNNKFSKNMSFLRFLHVFIIAITGLMYLFSVGGLVYREDTTGSESRLIEAKDRLAGTEVPLYYDRIEKPLPMFYSDGKVVAVDYKPLIKYINGASFSETIVYITNQDRYQKINSLYSNNLLLEGDGDFVLGRVRSDREVLEEKIAWYENEIEWIEKKSEEKNSLALQKVSELPKLKSDLGKLQEEYNLKLKEE